MGLLDNSQDPFENFRREKKMRALQRELQRRMESRQGQILKLIEQEERTEVLERRIQREMHEFFEDSTKLAASVLAEMAEQKAREISARITREMQEFFREILLRAERTIQGIRVTHKDDGPETDLETHLDPDLSQAFGGRPKTEARGEDAPPAGSPAPPRPEERKPSREEEPRKEEMEEEPSREETLLGGEVYVPEPEELESHSPDPGETREIQMEEEEDDFLPEEEDEGQEERMRAILQSLSRDPKKLKEALTALFRAGVIDREEARSLYSTYAKK